MNPIQFVRNMDRRLRVVSLCTALLLLPEVGHALALGDIARTGHRGDLAFFFAFTAIFIVPTSLILSAAAYMAVRQSARDHRVLVVLCVINLSLAADLTWFFFTA